MVNTHLRVADEVVKSEAPQNLIGQVGGPGLGRVPSRLDHRVQGHDDLEGGGQNVLGNDTFTSDLFATEAVFSELYHFVLELLDHTIRNVVSWNTRIDVFDEMNV